MRLSQSGNGHPLHAVYGYGLAVASVGAALGLTLWAGEAAVGLSPLFFAAVMHSAWFGGLGPGLLATILAGLSTAFFFIEPLRSFRIEVDDLIRIAVFMGVAVLISYLQYTSRRAEAKAARASRAKDDFLAVVSHELRNPLTPALASASLLEDDQSLPPSVREEAGRIRRSIELEARLINDLLDLTHSRRGGIKLLLEPVDVHGLIRDSLGVCEVDIEHKCLELKICLDASKAWVRADQLRLRQVFWNILKNAVKFTPGNGQIRITTANTSSGELEIDVTDTGIGIPPGALPRVFDAFDQGDVSTGRRFGGLGLGLAICRAIVDAHGGQIDASSPGVGKGATVRVRLPLAEGHTLESPQLAKPDPAAVPPEVAAGGRIFRSGEPAWLTCSVQRPPQHQ